ncbi:hypothetical protein KKB18_09860 [bacterium]|nr:hypothetical protein [bacterium]
MNNIDHTELFTDEVSVFEKFYNIRWFCICCNIYIFRFFFEENIPYAATDKISFKTSGFELLNNFGS